MPTRRAEYATRLARQRWRPLVESGAILCHLCGQAIVPGQPWDIDHLTPLVLGGAVDGPQRPAHARCNRAAGARLTNMRRTAAPPLTRDLKRAEQPRWNRRPRRIE